MNVRSLIATPAADPAARLPTGDQSNNENDILLDLRGYVQTDMPALAKRVGLSQHDFANALTATCRELQNFVKNYVDKEHRACSGTEMTVRGGELTPQTQGLGR